MAGALAGLAPASARPPVAAPIDSLTAPDFDRWPRPVRDGLFRRITPAGRARLEQQSRPGQPVLGRIIALKQVARLDNDDRHNGLAVQHLLSGYQLLEAHPDSTRLTDYALALSWNYNMLGQARETRQFAEAARRYAGPRAEPLLLARIYNALAGGAGLAHDYRGELSGYRRAAGEMLRIGHRQYTALYLGNLIQPYLNLHRYREARQVLDSALLIRPYFKQPDYYIMSDEAELLYHEGRYAEAVQRVRAIQHYTAGYKDYYLLADALRVLGPALSKLGRYREAFAAQQRLTEITDSLYQSASIGRMQEMQALYETQRQQTQLAQQQQRIGGLTAAGQVREANLRRRTSLLWAAFAVVGLLAALAAVLYNRSRLRQRANALLNDQKNALAVAAGKLQTLNATKDRLFALVAHDLRNPLAALTGIQTLVRRYVRRGEPERLVELGDHLEQTAHTLHGVLDNVLGWAISQRGELEPRPEPLDVALLVQEAAAIGQLHATVQDIDLQVRVAPSLPLTTDQQMLRTLLRNLLGNALKFTPAGGQVTLTAEATETTLWVRVADSGPGFSAAAAAAWAAAEVAPRTPDASGRSGQGLGLVVCRAFVRQLGGTLSWRNRPEGGAEVLLALPVAAPMEWAATEMVRQHT